MITRYRRTPIRLDFAPFVSIALLLIVFFVWQKIAQQPNVMGATAVTGCRKGIEPSRSKYALDILLLDNDTIQFSYHRAGSVCRANFVTAHHHSTKLRYTLFQHRKAALTPGELAIVIRPLNTSTIGNLVTVLDELRIAGNLPYLIVF